MKDKAPLKPSEHKSFTNSQFFPVDGLPCRYSTNDHGYDYYTAIVTEVTKLM